MSWITVDTDLPDHPKMAALPNDAARWGWIVVLCKAKQQRKPGTFANANHFRHVMGRHARFLGDYAKAQLMDKDEDGTLQVHDWKRHQWAGSKAQQRETSERQVEDKDETTEGLKEDASRAVPVPVSVRSSTEGVVKGESDPIDAFHHRTGEVPGSKMRSWLLDLAKEFTEQRLVSMIGSTPLSGSVRDYLVEVKNRLRLEDYAVEREKAAPKAKPPRKSDDELRAEREAIDAEVRRLMQPGAAA